MALQQPDIPLFCQGLRQTAAAFDGFEQAIVGSLQGLKDAAMAVKDQAAGGMRLSADQGQYIANIPAIAGVGDLVAQLDRMEQSQNAFQQDTRAALQGVQQAQAAHQQETRTAFQDVRNQMQQMRDDIQNVRGDIQDVRREVEALDVRSLAREHNTFARQRNSKAVARDFELTPLHALTTNQEIPNFPATSGEIRGMEQDRVDSILTHLGVPLERGVLVSRSNLAKAVGLPEAF